MAADLLPRYEVTRADLRRQSLRNPPLRMRYRGVDFAAERFLLELGRYHYQLVQHHCLHRGWLLKFRDDFRQLIGCRPCAGLREFLGVCPPGHPCLLIGVWLLGRCASRRKTFELERLPADGTAAARRHFAYALRRVESWPRLRKLAADHPHDAAIATLAARRPHDRFPERLARFAVHVDRTHEAEAAVASQMSLWIREGAFQRTDPKRPSWIRIVLERIKQWVRGERWE